MLILIICHHLSIHVLASIIVTWDLLSAPHLLCLLNIRIILFFIELVLLTFLRWIKVENMVSSPFDTMNTMLF